MDMDNYASENKHSQELQSEKIMTTKIVETVPKDACEPVMCLIACEHGLLVDEDGCPQCKCAEENPSVDFMEMEVVEPDNLPLPDPYNCKAKTTNECVMANIYAQCQWLGDKCGPYPPDNYNNPFGAAAQGGIGGITGIFPWMNFLQQTDDTDKSIDFQAMEPGEPEQDCGHFFTQELCEQAMCYWWTGNICVSYGALRANLVDKANVAKKTSQASDGSLLRETSFEGLSIQDGLSESSQKDTLTDEFNESTFDLIRYKILAVLGICAAFAYCFYRVYYRFLKPCREDSD